MNPIDNTFIGWVDDTRDYYVPDSVVTLSKADLVTRQLAIHANTPFIAQQQDPTAEQVAMTDAEVTAMAEAWYDDFVAKNSA
jgi:hypothetical protein